MSAPYTVESFLRDRANQVKRRLPGFWITVKVTDENDDDLELECRVNVHEERDAYGTGDSPTMYEVDIFEVVCNGVAMPDAEHTYYAKIVEAAIDEYRGY
jgi:hypothetical protein